MPKRVSAWRLSLVAAVLHGTKPAPTLLSRFLGEAAAELRDAADWYKERSDGLGLVLLSVFDTAVDAIARWPRSGALVEGVGVDLEVRQADQCQVEATDILRENSGVSG